MICIFHSVVLLRSGLVLQILKTEDTCFMAFSPKLFAYRFKNRLLYPELHHRDEICGPNRPCRLPLLMPDKPTLWCFHTGLFYNISCCYCCSHWCRDSNFQIGWKKACPEVILRFSECTRVCLASSAEEMKCRILKKQIFYLSLSIEESPTVVCRYAFCSIKQNLDLGLWSFGASYFLCFL